LNNPNINRHPLLNLTETLQVHGRYFLLYRKKEKYVNGFSAGKYAKQKHCDDYLKHAIIISVKRLWTVFLIVYYYYFQKLHARKGV